MMKKNLTSFLITATLIGSLASCSWGRKKAAEDDLDNLQDESGAATSAGTDAATGAVSTAKDGKTSSAYAPPKTEAFEVDGVWMNAYYYARSKDETLASISQTLYGTPDREKDLGKWNQRKKVNVGSLLYYSSATRADDHAKILSSTEDKGQALEEIEVKAGETISKIAQNRYGDFKTWREIAALNPQVDPNHLTAGLKLKVAPGGAPTVAAATTNAAPAVVETPQAAAAPQAVAAPQALAPQAITNTQPVVNAAPEAPTAVAPAAEPMANAPDTQAVAPKRNPASAKTKTIAERDPAEAGGWQGKVAPALEMFQENPALAGAVGLLALGLIGLGVRRLRSS